MPPLTPQQLARCTGARIDRATEWLLGAFQSFKCLLLRHPSPNSFVNTSWMDAKIAAGGSNAWIFNSSNKYWNQNTFILFSLLLFCGPTYIARLVVSGLINSVNGVAFTRHRPHVRNKGLKVADPWRKYGNSLPSVARPITAFLVGIITRKICGAQP